MDKELNQGENYDGDDAEVQEQEASAVCGRYRWSGYFQHL